LAIRRTSGDPQGIWASQSPLQIHIHGTLSRVCTKRSNGESSGELVKQGQLFNFRSFAEVGRFTKGFFICKEGLLSFCRADTLRLTSALELKLEVYGIFVNTVICVDLRSEKILSDKLSPENTIDTENSVRELSTEENLMTMIFEKKNEHPNKQILDL